eukprot:1648333-Rhodomonas_salina.1
MQDPVKHQNYPEHAVLVNMQAPTQQQYGVPMTPSPAQQAFEHTDYKKFEYRNAGFPQNLVFALS